MTSVFLSYARGDDELFAKRLYKDLTQEGFVVWWDRESLHSVSLTFHQQIKDAIRSKIDRLIYIAGPKAAVSNYVREEWKFALECDKPVISILRLGDYDTMPGELSLLHCDDFRDITNYPEQLSKLIANLNRHEPPLGHLFAVPTLPKHFMGRTEFLRRLKDAVQVDLQKPMVITGSASRVGVQGMGGIGKSVLAAAVARDREVRRAYPDGIIWVSFGQTPDVPQLMRDVAIHLGGPGTFENVVQGQGVLRELLLNKAVLFVFDDVWNVKDVQAFDVLGPRCRALVTTRDAGILHTLHGELYSVELFSEEEALSLLAASVEQAPDQLPPEAIEIVRECGCLPLAVALCGGMAKKRDGKWASILKRLQRADLEKITDRESINEQHISIWRAMQISVESLKEDEQKRFAELSVFVTDQTIPEAAVETLWEHAGNLDDLDTEDLLINLNERSLIRIEKEVSESNGEETLRVSMHDLLYDYALRTSGDQTELNETFLAAYSKKCPDGWSSGPNDGYFFQNLRYHLPAAARDEEFINLLFDLGWLESKVIHEITIDLLFDYREAQRIVRSENPRRHFLRLLEEAIARDIAFIVRHPSTIFQCLWNSCWWYDCPEAAQHYEIPESGWPPGEPPWEQPGPRLSKLVENWRQIKESDPGFAWLRMHSPPSIRLGSPLLGVFSGHEGPVQHLAFSPDGRRIISAGVYFDSELRNSWSAFLWDVFRRSLIAITPSDRIIGQIRGVQFRDSKGCIIVTDATGFNSEVSAERLIDVENGQLLQNAPKPTNGFAISLAKPDRYAPDHQLEVPVNLACEFAHDPEGKLLFRGQSLGDSITCSVLMPDDSTLITGDADGFVSLWSIETGQLLHQFCAHEIGIVSLAISPDGQYLATGGNDHTICLWDPSNREMTYRSRGFGSGAGKVTHSPDGSCTVTAARGKLCMWDTQTGELLHTIDKYKKYNKLDYGIANVAYSAEGRLIAFAEGFHIRVFEAGTAQCLWSHDTDMFQGLMEFSPDGQNIVTAGWDSDGIGNRMPYVFAAHNGNIVCRLSTGISGCPNLNAIKISHKGRYVVGVGGEVFLLWDAGNGRKLFSDYGFGLARCITWSPNDDYIAVGMNNKVRVACIRNRLMGLDAQGEWSAKRFNEEFALISSFGLDYDLDTGGKGVNQIAYLPDGRHLIAELDDHTMQIWDNSLMIAQLQGTCECASALPRVQGLPFLALSRRDETVIEDVATKKEIAWFPLAFQNLRSYPKTRTWRGVIFDRLHVFSLVPASYQISHIATPANVSHKRILLIDRAYAIGSQPNERHQIVRDNLAREYNVDTYEQLDERVPALISNALDVAPYNAVITHIPFEKSYSNSYFLMRKIKRIANIPIIAYTGASPSRLVDIEAGETDATIYKTNNTQADFEKIQFQLHILLSDERLRLRKEPPPYPRITSVGGYTNVKALIRLNMGVLPIVAMRIVNQCTPYPGTVTGRVLHPPPNEISDFDLKSILDLIGAALVQGMHLGIKIEGEKDAARKLASQLYSALTSRWSFDVEFDQFL